MKFILPLILLSSLAYAHDNLVSSDGQVVRISDGTCIRNGAWTPLTAISQCDTVIKIEDYGSVNK